VNSLTSPPPDPQNPGYIGEFEIIDDHRAGKIVIEVKSFPDHSVCEFPDHSLRKLLSFMPKLKFHESFAGKEEINTLKTSPWFLHYAET